MDALSALEILGLALFLLGVGLIYFPAALIFAGLMLVVAVHQPTPSDETKEHK